MSRKWCVIDAEGDVGKAGLLGVAFYSDDVQEYITDHEQIKAQLRDHAFNKYTFVAHNAQYDLPVIFWQLDIPIRAVYYNDSFNRGEWKYHPKRSAVQLWDSLDLSGGISVEQLGNALGLEKYATPQVLQGIDPDRYQWRCDRHGVGECVPCYALRDAEIVYRYMQSYTAVLAQWGVSPQRRLAGAASAVWRSLDAPAPIALDDGRIRYLARASFFGGRTECFKLGHFAPLYTADVASMYPSIMLETPFPDPAKMVFMWNPQVDSLPLEHEGALDCLVSIPHTYIPPLPNALASLRVFGTGVQRGVWTCFELRYALSQGAEILRCYRAAWSPATLYPFSNFIGSLWELRQLYKKSGDARSQTVKVLLNACYGRLGLRGDVRCDRVEPWPENKTTRELIGAMPQDIDGKLYIRYTVPSPYELTWTNVLWASYITSAARVKLHKYLILQGKDVVYCDTDSVFSMQPIVGIGSGLGSLETTDTYAKAWIVGPKLYCLESDTGNVVAKAKGVPRRLALAFLEGKEILFESPVKPRSMTTKGVHAGTWVPITRSRQLVPHRRTPTNPEALQTGYGWSDTVPSVFG